MKKQITTLLLLIIQINVYAQSKKEIDPEINPTWTKGEKLTIFAPNGLYLYKEWCYNNSRYSCMLEIIKYVPIGETVIFIAKDSQLENKEYYGIEAPMVKVKYKNIEGYIFSGLISSLPKIPNKCRRYKEYLDFNFGAVTKTETKEWCSSSFGEQCGETVYHHYKNGAIVAISKSSGSEGSDVQVEELINLGKSIHDSFLIALNCGPDVVRYIKYSKFRRHASGWYMDSDNFRICEKSGSKWPMKSIAINITHSTDFSGKNHLKRSSDITYSDECQ